MFRQAALYQVSWDYTGTAGCHASPEVEPDLFLRRLISLMMPFIESLEVRLPLGCWEDCSLLNCTCVGDLRPKCD